MSRIMIVEDNENLKNELIEFLFRYGYEAYEIGRASCRERV